MEVQMSSLSLVVIFAFMTIACVIGMAISAHQKKIGLSILSGTCALLFGSLVCAGMFDLGRGHIPPLKTSVLPERLETGAAYQLLASSKDYDDNQIILVKKTSNFYGNFYALRVKEVPPEHFTLVDGKPVAIAPPVPPVGVK
ncbi:MAG: hypothetical protein Q7R59_01400 [bacterium]|nr:hypothetical protein [bacterium]